ncbi:DUF2306 domain-containing protein [Paenibacillus sp. FSL W8-1187]|uniref:Putative membrane protein n=1 Tax=Paenibacillus pasadenensis TaxID=217090 RepID=A0A2N5N2T7_9BACL|nr:DUF2306 domain-containing protein [Paenibacillus pasadenensis]PLT44636.1 putative membrane protein [Paenibacillus pasadenensis]
MSSKAALRWLAAAAAAAVAYVLYKSYLADPQAAGFLALKPPGQGPDKLGSWLAVLQLHIAAACAATACGLLGFAPAGRRTPRRLPFHRWNGYLYFICVFLVCLTSGYMAPYATGGKWASVPFNLLNMLWPAITLLAILRARKRRLAAHKRLMIRSYAFCFNNMTLHLFTGLFTGLLELPYAAGYAAALYANIAFLLLAGELAIRMLRVPRDEGGRA